MCIRDRDHGGRLDAERLQLIVEGLHHSLLGALGRAVGAVAGQGDDAGQGGGCQDLSLIHIYYDVPLLCTSARPYGAESFDWIDGIIDNTMRIENGYAYPRAGAGWGFTFKEEALEEVR